LRRLLRLHLSPTGQGWVPNLQSLSPVQGSRAQRDTKNPIETRRIGRGAALANARAEDGRRPTTRHRFHPRHRAPNAHGRVFSKRELEAEIEEGVMAAMVQGASVRATSDRTPLPQDASVMPMPRVLIVDDEEAKRLQLSSALRVAGFEAHGVSSAEAAYELARGEFQVAIVDLMLHGTNGFELARRVRATNPAVRVVLTSAYHFTEVQLARVDCGAIGFVPQPFAIDELTTFLWAKLTA